MLKTLTRAAVVSLVSMVFAGSAQAGICFICKKSSTRACVEAVFCKSGSGADTPEDRKRCREAGCDIGGTATCPSSGDVRICVASNDESPWRAVAEAKTCDGDFARWFR